MWQFLYIHRAVYMGTLWEQALLISSLNGPIFRFAYNALWKHNLPMSNYGSGIEILVQISVSANSSYKQL